MDQPLWLTLYEYQDVSSSSALQAAFRAVKGTALSFAVMVALLERVGALARK